MKNMHTAYSRVHICFGGFFFRHICSGVIITEASVHGGIITRGENAETQLEVSKATCIHRFHDMPLQNESQET